jgi:uncharacterized membrane protein
VNNYIAVVFNSDEAASDGLHELWILDGRRQITVHGAIVLHRDKFGHIDVATRQTNPSLRTAIGVGVGALLGALAGFGFSIANGQSAVIAEVSEDLTEPIDSEMKRFGGAVYRRAKSTVSSNAFGPDYYPNYLYPYDYGPAFA